MVKQQKNSANTSDNISVINKRVGRNLPQAILTSVILVAIIIACIIIKIDFFVILIVIFAVLALWELRADFAITRLYIPIMVLWVMSIITILATFYAPWHLLSMSVGIMLTLVVGVFFASFRVEYSQRLHAAVEKKKITQHLESANVDNTSELHNTLSNTDENTKQLNNCNHKYVRFDENCFRHIAISVFTVLYVTLLASCIVISLTFHHHPIAHALTLVFLPACSDTGGLFAGVLWGKHKLSPRISPKKSVEGLIGSMVCASVGAYVVFICTYSHYWPTTWWFPLAQGILVGIVGTFGDLCASMLKRDIGIKDMGHLLKGHGGIIDRVDSILLSAPFLVVLFWITGL